MFIRISVEINICRRSILRIYNPSTLVRFIACSSSKSNEKSPDHIHPNLVSANIFSLWKISSNNSTTSCTKCNIFSPEIHYVLLLFLF